MMDENRSSDITRSWEAGWQRQVGARCKQLQTVANSRKQYPTSPDPGLREREPITAGTSTCICLIDAG
jgi:hypothetical protein